MQERWRWAALAAAGIVAALALASGADDKAPDGKALYEAKCALCHGPDGHPRLKNPNIPDFTDAAWQKKMTDEAIRAALDKGKPGTLMRSFRADFDDKEAAAVVLQVRKLAAPAK